MSMSKIGAPAFGIGILLAIAGAAKLPAKMGEYPDSWPIFAAGAALAVVGLVLWRIGAAKEAKANAMSGGDGQDPVKLLRDLVPATDTLVAEMDTLDHAGTCDRVDVLLDTYVLPFAEVRQRMIDRFGMGPGAEILVTLAYGERMLNRAWSAASDGHLPEARAVIPDARDAFQEALDKLNALPGA